MIKNIMITGEPHSGKSTLLAKIILNIPHKVGFVTKEIRNNQGRLGFEIETNRGVKTVFSHVDFKSPFKVSKYFVDIGSLETVIPELLKFNSDDILYLDEIGQMQLFSKKFEELVNKYLDSKNIVIVTLSKVYQNAFTDSIRKRNDTIIISLTENDRSENEIFIKEIIKKIKKAKRYVSEPERFKKDNVGVELKSEHGLRKLLLKDGALTCNCDFFNKYRICSHTIAAREMFKI
jgi:nucleoside-triphosphatase